MAQSDISRYLELKPGDMEAQKLQRDARVRQYSGNRIDSKELIREVQYLLGKLGYSPGKVDGQMGGKTRRAVRSFQQDQGLSINGKLTAELLTQLEDRLVQKQSPKPATTTQSKSMDDLEGLGDLSNFSIWSLGI